MELRVVKSFYMFENTDNTSEIDFQVCTKLEKLFNDNHDVIRVCSVRVHLSLQYSLRCRENSNTHYT